MPNTPDRFPGPRIQEEETQYEARAADPTVTGAVRYRSTGVFAMRDAAGVFNPRDSLQSAYDNGNTLTTASAVDVTITLSSGGFLVQGTGEVRFGSVAEVSVFTAASSGQATIQSRDDSAFQMQANSPSAKTLTLASSNAGTGSGDVAITADDLTTITSALGESAAGLRITQSGTGGDSADVFVGTSNPDGAVSARAASIFLRDTGAGAEFYQNTSSVSGTNWALGLNDDNHKSLRDLIHFIDGGPADGFDSGSYKETTYTGPLIATETWYEDNTKAQKIVDLSVSYTGVFPTTEVWRMYDADGTTVLVTLTDTITYSGPFEQTRTRTWA